MKNAMVLLIVFAGLLFSCTEKRQEITSADFDRLIKADSIEYLHIINDNRVIITKRNSKSEDEELEMKLAPGQSMRKMLDTQYPENKINGFSYMTITGITSEVFNGLPILLMVSLLVFFVIAAIDILKSRFASDIEKLIWIIVVIFVPLMGPILYLVIGRKQKRNFEH